MVLLQSLSLGTCFLIKSSSVFVCTVSFMTRLIIILCSSLGSSPEMKVGFNGYNQTKKQSWQWKSPQSPKAKKVQQVRSGTKCMLIKFFDIKGICSSWCYSGLWLLLWWFEVLERKCKAGRPKLWKQQNWKLYHDRCV